MALGEIFKCLNIGEQMISKFQINQIISGTESTHVG